MPSFSTDHNTISPYLSDESATFAGRADRIYFPTNASEIATILRDATAKQTGVSISGGGTSITGARVPTTGGWILATDRLSTVALPAADTTAEDTTKGATIADEIAAGETSTEKWTRVSAGDGCFYLDIARMRARVPAGLRLGDLDSALAPHGLFYPPTLTEPSAMIGGTIATNASGARSYHYGSTRAWVEALTVVTPPGEILRLRRGQSVGSNGTLLLSGRDSPLMLPRLPHLGDVKNAAGYFADPGMDAVDLFVGGEGTLGVVVEAEVRLAQRRSNAVTLLVFTRERDSALDFADAVREGALVPWVALAIEYFDRNSLEFMRESYPEVPNSAAAVLVELAPPEGSDIRWFEESTAVNHWLETTVSVDATEVWTVLPTEAEQVRLFRHSLPDHVNDFVRARGGKLGTDFAVPAANFRALMSIYDSVSDQGIRTVLFGHLGEYHLHLNFLANDAEELKRARELYTSLARGAVELGGTVSAEHGVGKKRITVGPGSTVPYLEVMYGPGGMQELRALKAQLDPAWILNRDTMMPWEVKP